VDVPAPGAVRNAEVDSMSMMECRIREPRWCVRPFRT
jgi:hypothetical protein